MIKYYWHNHMVLVVNYDKELWRWAAFNEWHALSKGNKLSLQSYIDDGTIEEITEKEAFIRLL